MMVSAAAFPAVHRFLSCLPWYRGEGVVKDHHQVFCTQGLATVMTQSNGFLAVIVALGAFPTHYRVTLSH
jgi:hypothetical protein